MDRAGETLSPQLCSPVQPGFGTAPSFRSSPRSLAGSFGTPRAGTPTTRSSPKADARMKVMVRVRPARPGATNSTLELKEDGRTVVVEERGGTGMKREHTVDRAFSWEATNEDIHTFVGVPCIDNALAGYNCCIFAYGVTGSGKTHTVLGAKSDEGIAVRVMRDMFESLSGGKSRVEISFMEVYNERVRDLLVSHSECSERRIREHPSTGVFVEGLGRIKVQEVNAALKLCNRGMSERATAGTSRNVASSRSHAILQVRVQRADEAEGVIVHSVINLVDLAGSENVDSTRDSGGALYEESLSINLSLGTLRLVMDKLVERHQHRSRQVHIPYRDSVLTRVLQDSLGGNSRTAMIACCSPDPCDVEATRSTLQYAVRARSIVCAARRNRKRATQEVEELRQQLAMLRNQSFGSQPSSSTPPAYETELKQELEEKAEFAREMLQRAAHLEKEKKTLQEALHEKQVQLEDTSVRHSDLSASFAELCKDREEDVVRLQGLELERNELAEAKQRLEVDVAEVRATSKYTIEELQAQLEKLQRDAKRRETDLEGQLQVTRTESDAARDRLKRRETEWQMQKQEWSKLETELTTSDRRRETVAREWRLRAEAAEAALDAVNKQEKPLPSACSRERRASAAILADLTAVATINRELREARLLLAEVEGERDVLRRKGQELEAQIRVTSITLEDSQRETDSLRGTTAALRERMRMQADELERKCDALGKSQAEIRSLRGEMAQVDELVLMVDTLQSDNARLRTQLRHASLSQGVATRLGSAPENLTPHAIARRAAEVRRRRVVNHTRNSESSPPQVPSQTPVRKGAVTPRPHHSAGAALPNSAAPAGNRPTRRSASAPRPGRGYGLAWSNKPKGTGVRRDSNAAKPCAKPTLPRLTPTQRPSPLATAA
eukprot:Hpha_TRINITY_DN9171_c0_g1::TRINITY_DN9171_c0_g1_i1::g.94326::m.94326